MTDSLVDTQAPPLLRHASFLRFWSARTCSTLAFQITAVVVGWQVFALTNSTFELGLIGLMQFLPMLVFTLPAGMSPTATIAGP